ncbi:hypothetical protein SMACR_01496 [Sordaria macrospora]|uniref:WGS project CABT00000000 data, contig 2.4 n=2 Tax=Sordaria macrospora TaxID=5147 RepID=F7VR00_SORMK|nr:uncharacterized protein SMAC_01496 [Sordaria macrospora k-hell]KAA8629131.1 hypothetical protein SMACR_01496 [Sordaria macrospora]WPJ58618.1 hypothetical protein SMAC4_01496 [Sordaria macrospora]CCC07933.1 unnamed protein product [Sordaria macrospora k-hell]
MPEEIITNSGNHTFTSSGSSDSSYTSSSSSGSSGSSSGGGSDGWRPRTYVPLPISEGSATGGSVGNGRCTDEAKRRR